MGVSISFQTILSQDDNPLEKIPDHITDMGSQEVFNYLGERLKMKQTGVEM